MEWLLALGLGLAAGTNAYIPLLITGALARWTGLVVLPSSWAWLESGWALTILSFLIAVEFLAQRVPGLASANDVLQTVLRPTSAGIVVTAQGSGAELVTDWEAWVEGGHWVPVAVAIVVALAIHLARSLIRVGADVVTAGVAGGFLAGVDEVSSVTFSLAAALLPILVPLVVVAMAVVAWIVVVRVSRRRRHTLEPENS